MGYKGCVSIVCMGCYTDQDTVHFGQVTLQLFDEGMRNLRPYSSHNIIFFSVVDCFTANQHKLIGRLN